MARAGKKVAVVEQFGDDDRRLLHQHRLHFHEDPRPPRREEPADDDTAEYFAKADKRRDTLTGAMRKKNHSMLADLETQCRW